MARISTIPCPFNRQAFGNKREAEMASPNGEAEKCGRCKQWHTKENRSGRRRVVKKR